MILSCELFLLNVAPNSAFKHRPSRPWRTRVAAGLEPAIRGPYWALRVISSACWPLQHSDPIMCIINRPSLLAKHGLTIYANNRNQFRETQHM